MHRILFQHNWLCILTLLFIRKTQIQINFNNCRDQIHVVIIHLELIDYCEENLINDLIEEVLNWEMYDHLKGNFSQTGNPKQIKALSFM